LVTALAAPARADGPDEPKQTEPQAQPQQAAPPSPAPSIDLNASGQKVIEETLPKPKALYGWAFGGIAVGTLVLGVALDGAASARAKEQNGDPNNPPIYSQHLHDRGVAGKQMATAGYVFLGVGALATLIDAVLWFEVLRKPQVVKRTVSTRPRSIAFSTAGVTF
jgi:hypothetical protein